MIHSNARGSRKFAIWLSPIKFYRGRNRTIRSFFSLPILRLSHHFLQGWFSGNFLATAFSKNDFPCNGRTWKQYMRKFCTHAHFPIGVRSAHESNDRLMLVRAWWWLCVSVSGVDMFVFYSCAVHTLWYV